MEDKPDALESRAFFARVRKGAVNLLTLIYLEGQKRENWKITAARPYPRINPPSNAGQDLKQVIIIKTKHSIVSGKDNVSPVSTKLKIGPGF